jgi:predicted nucleotidyltransferase
VTPGDSRNGNAKALPSQASDLRWSWRAWIMAIRAPRITRQNPLGPCTDPGGAIRQSSLALFGSVVRGAARPDSDIDVLVEVAPDARFSLIDLVSVKDFLEDRLGRRVDVVTKRGSRTRRPGPCPARG